MKSELGFKAVHREVTKVTGTYMRREQSEAHAVNFAVESDAPRQQTTIGDENAEIAKRERSPTCSENPGEFVCIPPKNTIKSAAVEKFKVKMKESNRRVISASETSRSARTRFFPIDRSYNLRLASGAG